MKRSSAHISITALLSLSLLLNGCSFMKEVSTKFKTFTRSIAAKLEKKERPKRDSLSIATQEPSRSTKSSAPIHSTHRKAIPEKDVSPLAIQRNFAQPLREFRAAWIATVANIDWPSKPGLPVEQQQQEAIALLNYLQENNFNAAIFQVRPQADALYTSALEPWSFFLTGEQDKAPDPFYDPLQFWIDEAHKRGIELHAWINPYRAHHVAGKEPSARSYVNQHPETVYFLKEGYWWMDPAMQTTQDHTTRVVLDIVKRYDVDGIHLDDYFYPYPSYNGNEDFPDERSWNEYVKGGGQLSRGDWRRESVNTLIERLYREIKKEKTHVKFGLSPFGIWRPGHPTSVEGFDQYDKLYADAKKWLNNGWIDYFTPQLYWPSTKLNMSFPVLLGWWHQENNQQRHLWPGISIGTDKNGKANNQEIVSEIMITRGMAPKSMGAVHWNISSLIKNPSLTKELREGVYKSPALIPSSPWLSNHSPHAPRVVLSNQGDSIRIHWNGEKKNITNWVVYYQFEKKWEHRILPSDTQEFLINRFAPNKTDEPLQLQYVMVTAIDRIGNESAQRPIAVEPLKINGQSDR